MIEVVVPEYSMHHPLGTENTSPILQWLKCNDTLDLSILLLTSSVTLSSWILNIQIEPQAPNHTQLLNLPPT
jgi:hypothetical protein